MQRAGQKQNERSSRGRQEKDRGGGPISRSAAKDGGRQEAVTCSAKQDRMYRSAMKEGEVGGKARVWSSPRKPRGREPARGSRRRALPKQEKREEGRGPETGAADDPPRWKEADEPCSGPEDSRGAETLPKGQDPGKRKAKAGGRRSGGPAHDQTREKSNLGSEVQHQANRADPLGEAGTAVRMMVPAPWGGDRPLVVTAACGDGSTLAADKERERHV